MSVYLLYPLFFSFCLQMEMSRDMCTFVELLVIVWQAFANHQRASLRLGYLENQSYGIIHFPFLSSIKLATLLLVEA